MYVSVRDAVLKEAGYGSIAEGLRDLKLDSVELEFYRDYSVFPADSWERTSGRNYGHREFLLERVSS